MAINSSSANAETKMKPVEQAVFDFFEIIIVLNPLSMFLVNLFAPHAAVSYVFSKKKRWLEKFYAFLAKAMPYKWNNYWIERVGVQNYSPKRQKLYYRYYDSSAETLKLLDRQVIEEIFWEYRDDHAFIEQICSNYRPSDELLAKLCCESGVKYLYRFMHYGPFNKSQTLFLIQQAKSETMAQYPDIRTANLPILTFLADYLKKFESDAEIVRALYDFNDGGYGGEAAVKRWHNAVDHALMIRTQKTVTLAIRKKFDEAKWTNFCKETDVIYPEVQMCMNSDQYKIFHNTGHQMSAEAILYFMQKVDYPVCFLIFNYEDEMGLVTEDIKRIVKSDDQLYSIYISLVNK